MSYYKIQQKRAPLGQAETSRDEPWQHYWQNPCAQLIVRRDAVAHRRNDFRTCKYRNGSNHSSFTTVHSNLVDRQSTEPEHLHCGLLSQEVDNEELWAVYHSVKKSEVYLQYY
ncbi:hypothetical protein M405DRAFT_275611 [Rhizopogon salebrosus TDB-379]|nr:hypothetical protein M405DRAFT_275611 [Rhizopogon salebrosus TDB-379]